MTIQTDLAFANIMIHQAELRDEASQTRLSRRRRSRNSLWERLFHRRSDDTSRTAIPTTDH